MLLQFGPSIQYLRKKKNYTQQQVADLLFVSRSTYAAWETNGNDITFSKLLALIDIYKIAMQDFMVLVEGHNQVNNNHYDDPALVQIMKRLENIEQLLHDRNSIENRS